MKLFDILVYSYKDEDYKDSEPLARAQTRSNLLLHNDCPITITGIAGGEHIYHSFDSLPS